MTIRMTILGLALLGVSAAAVAAPPVGKLKPGAAEADFLVNVYDTQSNSTQQGTTLGKHATTFKKGTAQAFSRKKPSAAVYAKTRAGTTVQATAYSNLSYDYVFHAKNQAAFDQLADYAATHDGTISVIKGFAKQYVKGGYGTAMTSIDAGAAITASFACTDIYGDCSGVPHKNPKFSFTIPGAVTISDSSKLDFAGHILLKSLANSYSPKSYAYAFIDPEVSLPDDFMGSASDFSIELSDGIDNAIGPDSIPEPNSWALLIAGFGLAGSTMRRRRVRAAA